MASLAYTTVASTGLIISDEETLFRRYRRKQPPDLVYEFTRDPGLLHQYYQIREQEFISVLGTYSYSGKETEHDRNGQVLVIRQGNFCIGGVRFNVKSPRKPALLPLEIDDFRIENHFPHLHLHELTYGQLGMFAVLPEFRRMEISREVFKRMFKKAEALNIKTLFCVSPMINSRLYRQDCIALGMETRIHTDIELPVYPTLEEVKLYLLSIELHPIGTKAETVSGVKKHHLEGI